MQYIGEMITFLSRGKEDMIVVSFRVSTIAALGCVHFMPFLPLELPSVADIDPKVDGDSLRRVYFSQTRYDLLLFFFHLQSSDGATQYVPTVTKWVRYSMTRR